MFLRAVLRSSVRKASSSRPALGIGANCAGAARQGERKPAARAFVAPSRGGASRRRGANRGRALELPGGGEAWITVHPSYLLRLQDKAQVEDEFGKFVEDLRLARTLLP